MKQFFFNFHLFLYGASGKRKAKIETITTNIKVFAFSISVVNMPLL